jgi:flagellar hook-associated protein 2
MSTSIVSSIQQGFNGVSKYASSLQSVLSRSVAIASLPLDSLNARLTDLSSRQSALQNLETPFLSLQQSVTSLQSTLKTGILNSSISDAGIATATIQSGASAGTYSIEVENLGSFSTALSGPGAIPVSDPTKTNISDSTSFTLQIGSTSTTITPAGTTLQSLLEAINSEAGDKVQATLVNVGSGSSSDYRLSLRAVSLGSDTISLADTGGNLISTSAAGELSSYKVAGLDTSITSTSRTVTLAPGLTITLTGKSTAGQATTISVVNSPTAIAAAFSSLATSYNRAVDAIAQHHGTSGGALQGDSLLYSLSQVLTQLGTFSNGSPSSALANFGITLDQSGHLSVNTTTFNAAANANFSGLRSTLGSTTTSGFLKKASDLLSAVENPVTGTIKSATATVTNSIKSQQKRIADEQVLVNEIQRNLTAQIARADSAIASLQSKLSYVTSLFAAYNGTSSSSSSNSL